MERKEKIFIAFMVIVKVTILTIVMIAIFSGCARPGQLSGGLKDKTPPQIDSLASTPNFQTNFQKKDIDLTFDEWIKLNDAFNQVVISPPLEYKYKVELKKRTVVFKFHEDEMLRDNATYTINFGDAIKDITEGNVAPIRFVFSTGDFIDSLSVKGKVVDAITKKPVKDILVMLYDNLADTVVRTERPFYFSKTNKEGQFLISNVRNGTFKVFALEDINRNYLFDLNNERIGFPDSLIVIADSTGSPLTIELFEEEKPLQQTDIIQPIFGLVKMAFNKQPHNVTFKHDSLDYFYYEMEKDSAWFWYNIPVEKDWNLYMVVDTLVDTIKIKKQPKTNFEKKFSVRWSTNKTNNRSKTHNPTLPFELFFNTPIEKIDTSKILLLEDTLKKKIIPIFLKDSVSQRKYHCVYQWKEETLYELLLLPGAISSTFGIANKDTLIQKIQVLPAKKFGNIALTIVDLKPEQQYIIELVAKSSKNTITTDIISGKDAFSRNYKSMEAGDYLVKITIDTNKNGHWDTGNYDLHFQPEIIKEKALEPLRSNWDLEAKVSLEE